MPGSMRAVFLSYASEDVEAARRLCDALRAEGIEVWFDQSELRGGDAWDRQIRKRIHDCALFVALISAHSNARVEGYFRREWRLAVERTLDMADDAPFLLPVIIDEIPDAGARVPDKFREVQWTRFPADSVPSAFVEQVRKLLSADVAADLSSGASTGATMGAPGHSHPAHVAAIAAIPVAPASARSRWPLWAAMVLLAVAAGYLGLRHLKPSKPPAEAASGAAAKASGGGADHRSAAQTTIAVLPFADLSEKKDQEYFASGMAAELIDLLAKVPGLKVIGRASSFQFRGGGQDLSASAANLGAAYLVDGSVRKSGDRVRVTVQLTDARDGSQRWSANYDQKVSDVLQVQDAIASNLARALQLTVSADFGSRVASKNPEAYDRYLRALHSLDNGTPEGAEQSCAEFQQVLELDPSFAPAAYGLGEAYAARGAEGWMVPTSIPYERARQAASLAIRLDPSFGSAHALLAQIHILYDWNWAAADREIQQARNLHALEDANLSAGLLAAVRGDWDQAGGFLNRARADDPLNGNLLTFIAWAVEYRSGHYSQAESTERRILEISPNWGSAYWFLGLSLLFQNRLDESLAAFKRERTEDGQFEGSALVYYAMGKKTQSDAALKQAIAQNGKSWASGIARIYAYRGEKDQAMQWLERAYSAKDEDLYLIKFDPLLKNLENDARYKAFLRKMNLPE